MASGLRRLVGGNWRLKTVALLVACGMWVGVVYARNPPAFASVQVPVQVVGLPTGLVVLPSYPGAQGAGVVSVKVAGIRSNVHSPRVVSALSAAVDLSSVKGPGRYQVALMVANGDPSLIELWSHPAKVSVTVDRMVTADLPVHVQVASGQLPPTGYSWVSSKTTVSPATVSVRAPSSIITKLEPLATISLANAKSTVAQSATVDMLHEGDLKSYISFTPQVVTVNAAISSQTSSHGASVYVVTSGQPASGYEVVGIQPSPLYVNITGASGTIASLTAVDTETVNLSGLTKTTTFQIPLVLPAGVTSSSTTVTVVVDVAPIAAPTPTPSPSATP
jgi:YbbR domain-containing protein